jgi:hypothetical protein
MSDTFKEFLTVDKNIVELLSRSTYQRNFSYALREMVSNAFDADATRVAIVVSRANNSLTITDNGNGMSRDEFTYYLRIAGKKRGKLVTPRYQRKRIGQFGVGFLSVFPFCRTLKVRTSSEHSADVLIANIPAAEFFARPFESKDVEEVPVKGVVHSEPQNVSEHFTVITLEGLTPLANAALSKELPKRQGRKRRRASSVRDASPIDRLRWELSDELPLAFPRDSKYSHLFRYAESQLMHVEFDGKVLQRNDIIGDVLDNGEFSIGGARFRYAICTGWKAIKPWEMRGVKLRLNNVGVGPRTDFEITRTRAYSRLAWLTGELHILEGLDDLVSVSRDAFVESDQFNALRERMAEILGKQAYEVESIEESAIAMEKQLSGGKQVSVASKKDVIAKSIKRLTDRGFKVQQAKPGAGQHLAVEVHRKERTISLAADHDAFADTIKVNGKTYSLEFQELADETQPCALLDGRRIVVNRAFPLFRSKRYGELFKRFSIVTTVASTSTRTVAEMLRFINRELSAQFDDYK